MRIHTLIYKTALAVITVTMAMLAAGCEKELDFKYHDIEALTVIEGTLTESGADVTIRLTTPMDEPMDRTCLTDAQVTLSDLHTGERTVLTADDLGHYRSGAAGVPGHEYLLTVSRDGKEYASASLMRRAPKIEGLEFKWISMPYDDVAALQVAFADSDPTAYGDCYWIRIYRNGEFYKWSTVQDDRSIDGVLYETVNTTRKDESAEDEDDLLVDGDEVRVTVAHVSKAFYDYLNAISSDSNGPRMFEGDMCLGYFLAAGVSESDIVFHPDLIDHAK